MKVKNLKAVAAVALVGLAASVACADKVVLNGGPGYGGGSFAATITREVGMIGSNPAPFSPFSAAEATISTTTFCCETGETFVPGQSYYVQYGTSANSGGTGSGVDPIGSASAWLFSRAVADGSALNGVFGSFSLANANHSRAVQEALWKLEGETYSYAGGTVGAWRDALVSLANSSANGSLYGVMLMRLWDSRSYNAGSGSWDFTGHRQDQFVLIPLPPAAWAGLGTIAAVIGFGYIRRRSLRSE